MPKRKKRTDLSALVEKYQGLSVVSEIERNLLSANRSEYPLSRLHLSSLYSESNYHLDKYGSLEESLRNDGFLVPLILVRREDGDFEIINGAKRFLLAKKMGYTKMPCVIADLSMERKIEYILQNIVQEGDNPLVKSHAFHIVEEKYGYTDEKISKLTSLSITQVRNLKRLKLLPSFIKEGLLDFTLSYSEARCLLNLPEEKQKELYVLIQKGLVSVRQLEMMKRTYLGTQKKRKVTLRNNSVTIQFSSKEEAMKYYPIIEKTYSD
jgi:ParB family transcriptional regulator, chromosome partitioning protein